MGQPLQVDTDRLAAAARRVLAAAEQIPTLSAPPALTGSDPVTAAIAAQAAKTEAALAESLPAVKQKAAEYAQKVSTAARLYEESDRDIADTMSKHTFGGPGVQEAGHGFKQGGGPDSKNGHDVPGPRPGDPPYATGQHPTLAGDPHDDPHMHVDPGSSDSVELSDNPPDYNGPAGPGRDAAWLAYLSQHNAAAAPGSVPKGLKLPNPDAVSDPGLKTVGAAAKQQGVSYAWGAGHPGPPGSKTPIPPGVSRGTLTGDIDGQAAHWGDGQRTGFDCSGLARFAVSEGHNGLDISKDTWGDTKSQYQALTAGGGVGTKVFSDADLKPGDLIYFGREGSSHHVAIYAGNGLMIQAHGSGIPVEISPMPPPGLEDHVGVHIPR